MNVREILNLVPDEMLDRIGRDIKVDKVNHKITGKNLFKVLLFSLAETTRISLRTIEKIYGSALYGEFCRNQKKSTARHSAFADRLSKINPSYFASIFQFLFKQYEGTVPDLSRQKLYIFDATLISLSAKLFHAGINIGGGQSTIKNVSRNAIKIVVGLKGLAPASVYFCKDQSEANDNNCLMNAITEASVTTDDILVFDRGLYDKKKFVSLDESQFTFVSRLQNNRTFKIVEDVSLPPFGNERIISDQKVLFFKTQQKKSSLCLKTPFRVVRIRALDDGKDILLFSNNFELTAEEISAIYKRRWEIEVFFRFIKQELNMKHFLAFNTNGLIVQIYMVLIFSILLLIYKTSNKLSGFKFVKLAFYQELELEIIGDIVAICGGDPAIFFERHQTTGIKPFF